MEFLNKIKSSVYNPAYYREILNKPFSYSLKYFLLLAFLAALVSALIFSISIMPDINKFISGFESKALDYYPDELEITVKNGKVSTNVEEPYFIKMPAEFKDDVQRPEMRPSAEEMENLLVIDTKSSLTADLFKNYKTAALLGSDSIAYYDRGAVKIQPLGRDSNAVITEAKFSTAIDKIMPYLKVLPLALAPIIFIFLFMGFIFGKLIYLIFGALAIWLMAKAMNRDVGYGKAYQLGLHAITLGIISESTVFWFLPELEFPFLFTILMLAIVWINLKPSAVVDNPPPTPATTPVSGGQTTN